VRRQRQTRQRDDEKPLHPVILLVLSLPVPAVLDLL
jgi:hypothetical protein